MFSNKFQLNNQSVEVRYTLYLLYELTNSPKNFPYFLHGAINQ